MMRIVLGLMAATAFLAMAQERPASGERVVYKVDLNIRDASDPAAKAGRHYAMLVEGQQRGTFKVGNRVPITGAGGQVSYYDLGVNIDCTVGQDPGMDKVRLHADIDLSSILPPAGTQPPPPNPTISQLRINVNAGVTPAKPTVVASIDDPATSRKVDVEATITRVN